jgi:molecular chaperone HscA
MLLDIYDPKAPPKPIGIDLGTTNSIVAYVSEKRPVALTTCDGGPLLPSVVYYGAEGSVIVGRAAKSYATREPERTLASVKRFLGKSADDQQTKELGAYRFAHAASAEDGRVVRFDTGSRVVTPVEVAAEILKSLGKSALDQLRRVGGAVITVPAYFDDAQRQATRDAGRLAGLEVLRLLNEPTAAALAYGLDQRKNGNFAVYDLGGGTFDVTILTLDDGVFQVRSTGGDSALGGDDMDRAVAEKLLVAMGATEPSQRTPEVVSIALAVARDAKHALTEAERTEVVVPGRGGADVTIAVERAELERLIEPLLDRTGRACRRALRDAGLSVGELDGVILVGGATRVPRVRRFVAELFGKDPLGGIDPELVVAYGAAIQADLLSRASDEVLLLDVLPLSLGLETMGGGVDKILPRNTTIPAGARSTFTTYADNQTGFELHVVQGERELAGDCRSLARFSLKGVPPMPAGMARLEVDFNVDENGLLAVTAREATTGISQRVEVKPSHGLTDDEVERMLIDALDHGEADFEARRLSDARVEAERLLLATHKALATDGDLLEPGEEERVVHAIAELRAVLSGTSPAAIQSRLDELDHATHAWAGRRMDRAVQAALDGRSVTDIERSVETAAGVDAHVAAHAAARESH